MMNCKSTRALIMLAMMSVAAGTGCAIQSTPQSTTLKNPAVVAADSGRNGEAKHIGAGFTAVAAIENGDIEEVFEAVDQLSLAFEPSELLSEIAALPPGQFPDDKPEGGIDFGDVLEAINPDLTALIQSLGDELVNNVESTLNTISSEGYSKVLVSADLPIVVNSQALGGAWTLGVNWSGTAKSLVVADTIEFDPQQALNFLESNFSGIPLGDAVTYDLPGDIGLTIDAAGQPSLQINNDSLLLTKAAETTAFGVGYSRQIWTGGRGSLFLGVQANAYEMRLSRIDSRLGDITDSDEIFDAIRDAEFVSENGFDADIGLLWVTDHYQFGATVANLSEASFGFPMVNEELYSDLDIIDFLRRDRTFTMERQVTLEGSLYSGSGRWIVNFGYDTNAIPDPMGDDYQWLSVNGAFRTDSWWLPGIRAGYRRNLAGTELSYVSLGLTLLKVLNVDLASTLDTVHIDGHDLPQGLMASIGFQVGF